MTRPLFLIFIVLLLASCTGLPDQDGNTCLPPEGTIVVATGSEYPVEGHALLFFDNGDSTGSIKSAECKNGVMVVQGRGHVGSFPVEAQNEALALIPCDQPLLSYRVGEWRENDIEAIGWVCKASISR